eukprot:g25677.t1
MKLTMSPSCELSEVPTGTLPILDDSRMSRQDGKKNSVIKYCLTGTSAASPPIPSMDFVLNIQTTGQVLPVAEVNITAVWQYLVLLAVVFFFSMLCAVIDPELSKVEARARTATRLPSVLRGVLAAAVRAAFTIIALFLVLSLNAGVLVAGLVGWALGFALTTNYFPLVGCIMAWCKARSRNHYVAKEGAAAEELDLIPGPLYHFAYCPDALIPSLPPCSTW